MVGKIVAAIVTFIMLKFMAPCKTFYIPAFLTPGLRRRMPSPSTLKLFHFLLHSHYLLQASVRWASWVGAETDAARSAQLIHATLVHLRNCLVQV